MNVRRYTARDMRDAMRQVRELQGPDAVILSSRRVDGVLEVVAALDGDEPSPFDAGEPAVATASAAPTPAPATALAGGAELAAVRRELGDLRSLLVQQRCDSEAAQWAARHPLAAEIVARLVGCGFPDKLARSLVGTILDDTSVDNAWSRLRARLSAAITTAQPSVLETGGMLALVGPTGVGKTTTLARLALRQIRRMGRGSVSLVSLDRQRFGAYKQLQAFGQMAGVPVMLMERERELVELAGHAGDGKLVLIDTAGQAARDASERRLFAQVRDQIDLETWLVIAATHQAAVLRQVLRAFQASQPSALVLTKVDESEQLGETLSVLLEQRLGLVFYSDGQELADHFHKADTLYLSRLALQETPASSPQRSRRMDRDETQINISGLGGRVGASRDTMMLDSVVPFGKRAHAAL